MTGPSSGHVETFDPRIVVEQKPEGMTEAEWRIKQRWASGVMSGQLWWFELEGKWGGFSHFPNHFSMRGSHPPAKTAKLQTTS